MKNSNRIGRINDEMRKELSLILRTEVKDPRVSSMASVLRVDTTTDLKYSKVYISVLGNDEDKKQVMDGLKNASGFIRRQVAQRVNLRFTPELLFKLDESTEYAVHMSKLIDTVSKDLKERETGE